MNVRYGPEASARAYRAKFSSRLDSIVAASIRDGSDGSKIPPWLEIFGDVLPENALDFG